MSHPKAYRPIEPQTVRAQQRKWNREQKFHNLKLNAPVLISLSLSLIMIVGLFFAILLAQNSQDTRSDASVITPSITTNQLIPGDHLPVNQNLTHPATIPIYLTTPFGLQYTNNQYQLTLDIWANLPSTPHTPPYDYNHIKTSFEIVSSTNQLPTIYNQDVFWDFSQCDQTSCISSQAKILTPNTLTIDFTSNNQPNLLTVERLDGNNPPPLGLDKGGTNRLGRIILQFGTSNPGCISITPILGEEYSSWQLNNQKSQAYQPHQLREINLISTTCD